MPDNKITMKNCKNRLPAGIGIFLISAFFVFIFLSGCSKKQLMSQDSYRQHYVDISEKYFPRIPGEIERAWFANINQDPLRDLILQVAGKDKKQKIFLLMNQEKKAFRSSEEIASVQTGPGTILFFTAGDLDRDQADDLVIIQKEAGNYSALILFNNKKGYYYKKVDYAFPPIREGIDRVDVVDIDHDGDLDLYFYGERVLAAGGGMDKYQSQLFINNGQGDFEDLTRLLLPSLPEGIVATSIADYSGDGIRDIFLVYGNGQNRLLLNNSVGKFADKTSDLMPVIHSESAHADWADFDGDGDNDLLVVNSGAGETCYFLENDGKGRFTKRSDKILPPGPTSRVYLLDANGDEIPDILLLSENTAVYLQGKGKWKFTIETVRRLPRSIRFSEMVFGDIDDDGNLDIFGIDPDSGKGKLWLNRFK